MQDEPKISPIELSSSRQQSSYRKGYFSDGRDLESAPVSAYFVVKCRIIFLKLEDKLR